MDRDRSDSRAATGNFSDVGWLAFMGAVVVVVTMLLVALSAKATP